MGYSEKFRKKLEDYINQGKTHKERVKLSFRAGKIHLTYPVSDKIRSEYDAINEAIESLDSKDKLMPKKKHELIQLKKQVPQGKAVTQKAKEEFQDLINKILGQKAENNNTPKK